ncbi:BspA family leucine-rich repeat surface protein [Mycoplasma feriruminatoris]|uniref:BspA family leucine-rich repeat surface protein n=1 Tax=Mycoplasma feriruminatoris TaxID=1179777 RepID=A0A654IG55_9MOLU|nr:BspA family leucine-rich repeat surface protein [Mycoplasma feriruminatoris]WFQ89895.1 hypothetical protein MFERI11561_00120 [Mycoplasma feriruminatoris]WFQ93232.1 BspA family leucine-rich repeat surface protein [Mycoplasma feriruminatoris]WFQ94889.1 BspA family leucine-rich repeat surface protein [Mycoplasma feriruminatoris]VZR97065.1 hypothetical protein MF5295_00124 [Mycoplasma feriruminatoris]
MKKILKLASYSIFTSLFISIPIFNFNNNEKTSFSFKQETKKQYPYHKYSDDKTEIKELGYYEHPTTKKVTIRPIPYHVTKVPEQLPTDIESLYRAFAFRYEHHEPVTGFEKWDTKNITDMSYAFYDNQIVNVDLSKWNTSKVTNMDSMFRNAIKFNNGGDPLSWTTNSVTSMESMFDGAKSFKQNLMSWNVDKVTNNKNFSRGSGIFKDQSKNPKWKNPEIDEPIVKKPEPKQPKVIIHPSPSRPKVTIPLTKIITPVAKSNQSPKTTPKPNSSLVIPKSTMTQSNQSSKKLSTPAIIGIVVGTQAVLTSLGFGIPYIIKKIKK